MNHSDIFAIGDIHGCATELSDLLAKLPLTKDSTVVFLGDYIDRGPNSKGVIQQIIDLSKRCHVIALMGNHEAMLLEFLRDPSSALAGFFILNGGSSTLASYVTEGDQYIIPEEHLVFFKDLPKTHSTDRHFFVHAGVPPIKLKKISEEKHGNDLLWIRKPFLESDFKWEKIVVHGHTPVDEVDIRTNRINMDTGCVYQGRLSAIEVNSGEVISVEAREQRPKVYLKESTDSSRVAKRFVGSIPVFVESDNGYQQFQTLNYNEFGMLIIDENKIERVFEVGQILKGKIGSLSKAQLNFVGQVVRHQKRGDEISYGIKMLISPSYKQD